MNSITELQKALYSNIDTLRALNEQIERLDNLIEKINGEILRNSIIKARNGLVNALGEHIRTTERLIKALKKTLKE